MDGYKVAVQADIHKEEGELEIDRWLMVAEVPWSDGDVDESNVKEMLEEDEKIKALPDGDYHVFFTANVHYEENYSYEYGVHDVEVFLLEAEISIWKPRYNPETREAGHFI